MNDRADTQKLARPNLGRGNAPAVRRPMVASAQSDAVRKLKSIRNEIVLNIPALVAPKWLEAKLDRLDFAIENVTDSKLHVFCSASSSQHKEWLISQLFDDPSDAIAQNVHKSDAYTFELNGGEICFLFGHPDQRQDELSELLDMLPESAQNAGDTSNNRTLEFSTRLNREQGVLTVDRETSENFLKVFKSDQSRFQQAVAALKTLQALKIAEDILTSAFPTRSEQLEPTNEIPTDVHDDYEYRKQAFHAEVDEIVEGVEKHLEEVLASNSVSTGSFFLAINGYLERMVSQDALEEEIKPSVASLLKVRRLTKLLYKEKSKIRMTRKAVSDIGRKIEQLVSAEVQRSEKVIFRAIERINQVAAEHRLQSVLFGVENVTLGSQTSSGNSSTQVRKHLSSALKSVSDSFSVDHEYKGLLGRLFEARMAMLSIMMMVFMVGRGFEVQLSNKIYKYMLGAIVVFALISSLLSPLAQKIERQEAIERLKKTLNERLSSASERAYTLSVQDLESQFTSFRTQLDRNAKALDEVLRSSSMNRLRQSAVSAITRTRSDSLMSKSDKVQNTISRVRAEMSLSFADAVKLSR